MYLRFKAHGYIIKETGIIQPESRYLMSGIAVSIKADSRYYASGMVVQNCPEYSIYIYIYPFSAKKQTVLDGLSPLPYIQF